MAIKNIIDSVRVFFIKLLGVFELIKAQRKTTEQISELRKDIATLVFGVVKLAKAQEKTQEYMVQLATLQEELMNQVETAQVMLVKVNRHTGQADNAPPASETLRGEEGLDKALDDFIQKKKAMN